MARPSHQQLIAEIVGRARLTVPWPERTTLPDGSVQYSGLTDAELNDYLARRITDELARLALPDDLVQEAARSLYAAEADLQGQAYDEATFKKAAGHYRSAAMTGFRVILRQFARG